MDIRIKKTEGAIKNSFLKLRSQKALEKITVRELCKDAEINKSTFYAHYKDIYDLSDAIQEEVVASVMKNIAHPEYLESDVGNFTMELCVAYFSQKSLIDILFSGNQKGELIAKIEKAVKEMCFERFPHFRNDMRKNIFLSYSIQGAYSAFESNKEWNVDDVIRAIVEITRKTQSLYEE